MASPLSNPHLSSVTHTQPTRRWQETQRQRQLAPSTASSIRHRRLRHRPSRGRGLGAAPTKQERARRTRRLCAGVRGIEVLSARRSGCEARTAHRARPTRRACRAEIEGE
eukprot:scaffold6419_cov66-Phaeocystis_antarctica.AAC.1